MEPVVHCDKWPLGGASGARKNDALKWVHSKFFLIKSKNMPPIFFWPRKNLASKNWGVRPRKLQPLIPGLLVVIGAWNLCRNDRFWKTNWWCERRGSPSTRREVTAEGFWRDQEGAWKNLDKKFFLDKSPLFFLSPILFFVSLVGVNVAKKQENVSNWQEKKIPLKEVKVRKWSWFYLDMSENRVM